MYKEMFASRTIESEMKKSSKNIVDERKATVFQEILCPKLQSPLKSHQCMKCAHKKIYHRRHPLGLTLATFVCTYEEE